MKKNKIILIISSIIIILILLIFIIKPKLPFGPGPKSLDFKIIKDVPYATDSPSQVLDIYIPNNSGIGNIPVVIFIHGGAFMAGDKNRPVVAPKLLENGYAVVSVNYRLSGEAEFPAAIQDIKSAVRWVKANSQRYNLDSENIGAIGDSAGGTFVSFLGLSTDIEEFKTSDNEGYSDKVDAVVDMYGLTDFTMIKDDCENSDCLSAPVGEDSFLTKYLGCDLDLESCNEIAKAASPITYVDEEASPFFIIHGDKDRSVPNIQSVRFVQALNDTGTDTTFIIAEGYGHETRIFTDYNEEIISFFDKHLKR